MGESTAPSYKGLEILDAAHAESFPVFLGRIGHDAQRAQHRARAGAALTGLQSSLQSNEGPNYSDPYVAAAYLVEYHLEHVMLAYWAFRGLFDQVEVPKSLYVLDVAAGTGAGRVGLAIALAEMKERPAVRFESLDISEAMLLAGDCFWDSLQKRMSLTRDFEGRNFRTLPARVSVPEGAFRIVTGFHPTLPYDSVWWGESSAVMGILGSALSLVSPHAELFSCLDKKSSVLSSVLAGFSADPEAFRAPESKWALGGRSSDFYDWVAVEQGFEFQSAGKTVTTHGGYRFGFPKDSILYRRVAPERASAQEEERRRTRVASWREDRSRQQRAADRDSLAKHEELRRAKEEWERTEARLAWEAEQRAAPAPVQSKPGLLKRIGRALFG